MVGRPGKFQPRFTSGELDELIQANTDLHIYGMGASLMQNVMPLPQGGFRGRYGTLKRGRLNPPTTRLTYVASSWLTAAPTGGVSANPVKTPPVPMVTNPPGATGRNVVWHLDLADASTRHISAIDVIGFSCPTAGQMALTVEWSNDNATWHQIDNAHGVGTDVRSRRFMAPQAAVDGARYWQIVYNLGGLGSFPLTINQISFFSQPFGGASSLSSKVRIKPFNYSVTESYDVVFTDYVATIYRNGAQVGVVPTPYAGQVITELDVTQALDTMLVFHDGYQPLRIMRQGSATEWNWDVPPFAHVPNVDYGGVYSNGIACAWDLQFFGFDTSSTAYPMPGGGAHFQLTVNNQVTANILFTNPFTDASVTAGYIKAALEALPNVNPGVTVTYQGIYGAFIYRVSFTGVGNEGDAWAVSGRGIDKGDTAITATHSVIGIKGGEAIMSSSRGWPACGVFYAQRLLLGGFAGKPNYLIASVVADFFNYDTSLQGSEAGMVLPLDTQGAEQILNLHVGRNLIIFTGEAEYYLFDHVLDATAVPQIVLSSRNGLARGVYPVENEAKTIFTHRNRGRLFEFGYSYPDQNYISTDMSVQSSSLVENVVDNALRKATTATDVNTLFIVKADGTGLAITLLRGQDVTAFARNVFQADDLLAVDVNGSFDVNVCTQRSVGGAQVQFLETVSNNTFLDQAETHVLGAPGTLVTGLADLEGATVWAQADGYWQGPFTVTGGQTTLNFPATNVTVGRWTPPDARTLPQPRDVAPKTVVRRPARVHTVRCTVVDTTSIAIGANDQPPWNIDLARFGGPVDQPMAPYSGEVVVEGILGWSKDAIVQITQMKPGALTVTGVTVEVDL